MSAPDAGPSTLANWAGQNDACRFRMQVGASGCWPTALDTLLDALAIQDMLIVLDNCEHLIGACAKTADAIVWRCPRVHLVATSREPLGIGPPRRRRY